MRASGVLHALIQSNIRRVPVCAGYCAGLWEPLISPLPITTATATTAPG